MAIRQAVSKPGDGRVAVDEFLIHDQRPAVLRFRLRRLARVCQKVAEIVIALRKPFWTSVSVGSSFASFCLTAIASTELGFDCDHRPVS